MLYVSMMLSQVPRDWRALAAISIECGIALSPAMLSFRTSLPVSLRGAMTGARLGQVNSDCMVHFGA